MRIRCTLAVGLLLAPAIALAQAALSPADTAAAFEAAGFARIGNEWRACEDPGTASYSPGAIESVADVNGDGLPEAVITESSLFCHGNQGAGYVVVSQQGPGRWRRIAEGSGMISFLKTRGVGGWPDIEVGGPGFCFPVERWNGREYARVRFEYEGKNCTPVG
jgi:hypothetical protein